MATPNELVELLLDRGKAREALPHIHEQIERKREELRQLEDAFDALRRLAGISTEKAPREGTISEQVVTLINESPAPMHARDVLVALGSGYKKDSVQWALWDAAKRGLIIRTAPNTFSRVRPPSRIERELIGA